MSAVTEEAPAVAAEPVATPRPRWWRGDFGRCGLLVLTWQLALTLFGAVLEPAMRTVITFPHRPDHTTLLTHTVRWDSGWFLHVLQGAYATNPAAPAFYPLFPLCVHLLRLATFGAVDVILLGLLLNTVASWLAVTALLKIGRLLLGADRPAWWAIGLLLSSPAAFFLHSFYSEATFMAVGFWAYLFALRRQWTWMGLCLIPLTASRITAVLFLALCLLEFARAHGWWPHQLLRWPLLWFPASALGFGGYALYLGVVSGHPWGMTTAYSANKDWSYHRFNPNIADTLWRELTDVCGRLFGDRPFTNTTLVNEFLPLLGLALLLAASIYLIVALRGPGVPLGVFGLLGFVMFTLNSNTVSVHRYLLPCLGLYLALALLVSRRPAWKPVLHGVGYLGALVQAVLFVLFTSTVFAG